MNVNSNTLRRLVGSSSPSLMVDIGFDPDEVNKISDDAIKYTSQELTSRPLSQHEKTLILESIIRSEKQLKLALQWGINKWFIIAFALSKRMNDTVINNEDKLFLAECLREYAWRTKDGVRVYHGYNSKLHSNESVKKITPDSFNIEKELGNVGM